MSSDLKCERCGESLPIGRILYHMKIHYRTDLIRLYRRMDPSAPMAEIADAYYVSKETVRQALQD